MGIVDGREQLDHVIAMAKFLDNVSDVIGGRVAIWGDCLPAVDALIAQNFSEVAAVVAAKIVRAKEMYAGRIEQLGPTEKWSQVVEVAVQQRREAPRTACPACQNSGVIELGKDGEFEYSEQGEPIALVDEFWLVLGFECPFCTLELVLDELSHVGISTDPGDYLANI